MGCFTLWKRLNDCGCSEETGFYLHLSVVLSSDKCHDGKLRSCAGWQRCEANSVTPKFVKFEILEIPQSCKITERFNIQNMNLVIAQFHQPLTLEITVNGTYSLAIGCPDNLPVSGG